MLFGGIWCRGRAGTWDRAILLVDELKIWLRLRTRLMTLDGQDVDLAGNVHHELLLGSHCLNLGHHGTLNDIPWDLVSSVLAPMKLIHLGETFCN